MSISWTSNPTGTFDDLALDLLGPMPTGVYLLVVIDVYFSRYYEVEIFISVSACQIISRLVEIFAAYGLPTDHNSGLKSLSTT